MPNNITTTKEFCRILKHYRQSQNIPIYKIAKNNKVFSIERLLTLENYVSEVTITELKLLSEIYSIDYYELIKEVIF